MKNSIKIYLSFVVGLLVSGAAIAHADTAPKSHAVQIHVQKISYNTSNMMVTASGIMPNPCTAAPHPELQKTADPAVLQLVVAGEMYGDVCIDVDMDVTMVGNNFELAFDIRSLKFDLADLHVNTEGAYKIIGQNGALIAEVNFGKVAYDQPFASHEISNGVLTQTDDGSIVAVAENATRIEVRSPLIDLQKYIGCTVDLSGFVVNAHSDGFAIGRSPIERPLFLITGLNTTTH